MVPVHGVATGRVLARRMVDVDPEHVVAELGFDSVVVEHREAGIGGDQPVDVLRCRVRPFEGRTGIGHRHLGVGLRAFELAAGRVHEPDEQ